MGGASHNAKRHTCLPRRVARGAISFPTRGEISLPSRLANHRPSRSQCAAMLLTHEQHRPLGGSGLTVPPVQFSAAPLGNARRVIPDQTKRAICGQWFEHVAKPVVIDASFAAGLPTEPRAGTIKGGPGLALENVGQALRKLEITPDDALISVRLGWTVSPLRPAPIDPTRTQPQPLTAPSPARRATTASSHPGPRTASFSANG